MGANAASAAYGAQAVPQHEPRLDKLKAVVDAARSA